MTKIALCEPYAQTNSEESVSQNKPVEDLLERLLDLSEEQSKVVKQLVLSEQDLFSKGLDDLGSTNAVRHWIETGNAAPIKQQPH